MRFFDVRNFEVVASVGLVAFLEPTNVSNSSNSPTCEVERAMDVELQILKYLKRSPTPTVSIIDRYCDSYNDLFSDVRNYEYFKYLHQGMQKQGFLVVRECAATN